MEYYLLNGVENYCSPALTVLFLMDLALEIPAPPASKGLSWLGSFAGLGGVISMGSGFFPVGTIGIMGIMGYFSPGTWIVLSSFFIESIAE